MQLAECAKCGSAVRANARQCENCGADSATGIVPDSWTRAQAEAQQRFELFSEPAGTGAALVCGGLALGLLVPGAGLAALVGAVICVVGLFMKPRSSRSRPMAITGIVVFAAYVAVLIVLWLSAGS